MARHPSDGRSPASLVIVAAAKVIARNCTVSEIRPPAQEMVRLGRSAGRRARSTITRDRARRVRFGQRCLKHAFSSAATSDAAPLSGMISCLSATLIVSAVPLFNSANNLGSIDVQTSIFADPSVSLAMV